MPKATVIDMVSADKVGSGVLSQAMVDGLTETLQQEKQSILFLNRRGFSPFVTIGIADIAFAVMTAMYH